ncbi:hypothetical protein XENOCAPTIV_010915 [Xenoophorus captivus]|uniref:Transmembrane protein 54b n=1 Tax=Xenoophorus captivus TaxID=1517983 RepID=A0ABV0QU21_9TELE
MGLTLVLVGHVNFLLGALVHGAVLRHIVVQTRVRTLVYAISNIIAIVAGLMATSIILWMPLIVMCVVEAVFTFRCFAACTSFLYLCPCRKEPLQAKRVRSCHSEVAAFIADICFDVMLMLFSLK